MMCSDFHISIVIEYFVLQDMMDRAREICNSKVTLARTIGVFSLILGFLIFLLRPFTMIKDYYSVIHEGGMMYESWRSAENLNVLLKAYAFNVSNRDAFLAGKEKLKVEEVGPFVYREMMVQENIEFHHEEGIVISEPRYWLEWDPRLNTYSEDTVLMVPNLSKLLVADTVKFLDFFSLGKYHSSDVFTFFTGTQSISNYTWKQFAFDGDPNVPNLMSVGILREFYNHQDDISVTYTGEKILSEGGLLKSYNGLTYVPGHCGEITSSSTGLKFGKDLTNNNTVYIHRKGICRTIPLVPKEMSYFGYMMTYRVTENAFDYKTYSERRCFCSSEKCLPRGLSDLAPCYRNFPIALSLPHFYNAEPSLREQVEGLKPEAALHQSHVNIIQELGVMTDGSLKLQLNLVLDNMENEKLSGLVVPLIWLDLNVPTLPLIKKFQFFGLQMLTPFETIICPVLFIVGAFLLFYYRCKYLDDTKRRGIGEEKVLAELLHTC